MCIHLLREVSLQLSFLNHLVTVLTVRQHRTFVAEVIELHTSWFMVSSMSFEFIFTPGNFPRKIFSRHACLIKLSPEVFRPRNLRPVCDKIGKHPEVHPARKVGVCCSLETSECTGLDLRPLCTFFSHTMIRGWEARRIHIGFMNSMICQSYDD